MSMQGRTGVFALLCTAHYIAGFNGQTQRPTSTATALTPLSYRPYGRYLNTILEIIGYFNLFSPSAMPISTHLKTPPSLRDTSSINRGGLKSFCSSFILIANAVLFGRAKPGAGTHKSLSYRPYGRYLKTILEIIGYLNLLNPSAMPSGTTLKTPPSLRDTSSINRGGLKVLDFKLHLYFKSNFN